MTEQAAGEPTSIPSPQQDGEPANARTVTRRRRHSSTRNTLEWVAVIVGAVVVALGHEMAGIMGNDQKLIDDLIAAGKRTDEPLWQLPLWDCHRDQIRSKFADVANLNGPQYGNGSTAGGAFLSFFAGDTSWAHLDIAGAAYNALPKDYYKSGATGTAVRTLLDWVRTL